MCLLAEDLRDISRKTLLKTKNLCFVRIYFTKHAKMRIKKRGILESEVVFAVKNPDRIVKKHKKYYLRKQLNKGNIEIVVEVTRIDIKIITVYWL